ncbi:hypothetical protein AB838_10600 [Rhodobacteraceae bacterium (ex Bugula neritina AB1)]|nr:hypothetical protein AB838_10600 [Rhodobacteraceae bacterium (ex Bugula neritina AB1)]
MDFIKKTVFGLHGGSKGSKVRRFSMRISLYWSLLYVMWTLVFGREQLTESSVALGITAATLMLISFVIFVLIVLLMPFRDSVDFRLDAKRLLADTIVSSILSIVAFSLLYRNVGLVHGGDPVYPDAVTALYFSSVTFSTLGYGDFAPNETWRIVASTQALIGNLHLGMIVGSTFAAIRD